MEPRQVAPFLPGASGLRPHEYSESTAEAIDAEIERLLEDAHARVRETLTGRRLGARRPGQAAPGKEVVDRATLDELPKSVPDAPAAMGEAS